MSEHFMRASDQHCYNTRFSRHAFVVPKVNSTTISTFYYSGISAWNNLPGNIQGITNKAQFKSAVRKHLFTSQCAM